MSGPPPALPSSRLTAFSALRHRDFRLFFWGQLVTLVGVWIQQIALSWMVLELTDSAWYVGLVNALESLPVLLLSLYAGVVIDRMSRHRLVVITKAALMVLALALAGFSFAGVTAVWPVMVIATLIGVVNAFDIPARHTLFGDLVGRDDLMSAIALNSSSFNSTRIIGPLLAGSLLAVAGPAWCFLLNGLSYIAVLWGLFAMRPPAPVPAPPAGSAWANMMEGLRYLRRDQRSRTILILLAIIAIFGAPFLVLLPLLARDVLGRGAVEYGWMMAAVGVGALAGALWSATYSRVTRRGRTLLTSATAYAILIALLAIPHSLGGALLVLAGLGFSMIVNGSIGNTLLQIHAPERLRGRVISVYTLVAIGFGPLGAIQAGAIAERIGVASALALGSLVCLVGVLWAWRREVLRETA